MLRPIKQYRIAIVAILLLTILFIHLSRGPQRHRVGPRRPAETPTVWRSLRTAWTFRPGLTGSYTQISDLVCRGSRLFYVCECEAGCIDTSIGHLLWRYPFVTPSAATAGSYPGFDWRKITADNRCVYTSEGSLIDNSAPSSFHLRALSVATGKIVWARSVPGRLMDRPCLAADLLLAPLGDGTIMAVNRNDGSTVWRTRVTNVDPGVSHAGMVVQAAQGIAVAQLGAARMVALRVSDGAQLWSYPSDGQSEGGDSDGVAIKDGIVYACLGASELLANDAATGRRLWTRVGGGYGSPSPAVVPSGDLLVVMGVAVDRRDGHTVWIESERRPDYNSSVPVLLPWRHDATANDRSENALFEVTGSLPRLNGAQKQVRSVWGVDTLVMLDPSTGREQWRWQPEDGLRIDKIASDGNRLYISDGNFLRAVEQGSPSPLPTRPERRRKLARWMVLALTAPWQASAQMNGRGYPFSGTYRAQMEPPGDNEAKLTLLRLGSDSVPAFLDFVSKEVTRRDARLPAPGTRDFHIWTTPDSLADALDLLSDIGDRSCAPDLVRELKRAKHPISRKLLAEALIRLGNPCAVPVLFRYAQSDADCPETRQDALYWVCRAAQTALPQQQVTHYLLASLMNKQASVWLRLFARFELLNDRGANVEKAARASFEGEGIARLLPANPVMTTVPDTFLLSHNGFPTSIYPLSVARDTTGRFWAAFRCDYLGDDGDLWFAQSTDGKRWTKPAFGMNLTTRCTPGHQPGTVTIRLHDQIIEINWTEENWDPTNVHRAIHHSDRLAIADLYRDSDGDGLPDLLEKEIGTDCYKPDTNGNGIPDSLDKNPAYRPDSQTDEEGIYQAAVEALCQVGRSSPDGPESPNFGKPIRLGDSHLPLILHLPPGSAGVQILGHPGPVIARPVLIAMGYPSFTLGPGVAPDNCLFTPPHIDLAGVYHDPEEQRRGLYERSADPFTNVRADDAVPVRAPTFRDYFPYVRSADGNRARVGWEQSMGGSWESTEVGFDVEVRKVHGRWVAVECRRVSLLGQQVSEVATIPQLPAEASVEPALPRRRRRGTLLARR